MTKAQLIAETATITWITSFSTITMNHVQIWENGQYYRLYFPITTDKNNQNWQNKRIMKKDVLAIKNL